MKMLHDLKRILIQHEDNTIFLIFFEREFLRIHVIITFKSPSYSAECRSTVQTNWT